MERRYIASFEIRGFHLLDGEAALHRASERRRGAGAAREATIARIARAAYEAAFATGA